MLPSRPPTPSHRWRCSKICPQQQHGSSTPHFWLDEPDVGDLATPLHEIRATAGLIVDEFEKVQALRATASDTIETARAEVATQLDALRSSPPSAAAEYVDALRGLRRQQGHLVSLRGVRYVDGDALAELDEQVLAVFNQTSADAADFFAAEDAFAPFHGQLVDVEAAIASTESTVALAPHRETLDELTEGLEVLTQVVGSLEIDDPTVRTAILERVAEVMGGANRARAIAETKRTELVQAESGAAFGVEFALLGQTTAAELARATTPEASDAALGRLLLQLEEMESRFAELDEALEQIATKREEIYETFASRKQTLLDDRQQHAQRLTEAADRILGSIGRRLDGFASTDDLNAWFIADPMVAKVRSLAEDLRALDQPVAADELLRRLDASRDDAGRSLRGSGRHLRRGRHGHPARSAPILGGHAASRTHHRRH